MIVEPIQFKELPKKYKDVLKCELDPEQFVYVVKSLSGVPKTITTSITKAITKGQTSQPEVS